MDVMKYRWEISNRNTKQCIISSCGDFSSYEDAKKDMFGWLPILKREYGVTYNYTIYDANRKL